MQTLTWTTMLNMFFYVSELKLQTLKYKVNRKPNL